MNRQEAILIVDDDEHICRSLSVILAKKGYRTEIAHTGRKALEKARQEPFDAVLLDAKLPDTEGLALIALLKKRLPGTPVIVITAYGSVETARRALRRGASGYVAKPFGVDDVWEAVAAALASRRLGRREGKTE